MINLVGNKILIYTLVTLALVGLGIYLINYLGDAKLEEGRTQSTLECVTTITETSVESSQELDRISSETNNMEENDVIRDLYALGIMRDYKDN